MEEENKTGHAVMPPNEINQSTPPRGKSMRESIDDSRSARSKGVSN